MTDTPNPLNNIPEALTSLPRWITWKSIDGKKIPNAKINDPSTWSTFAQVQANPTGKEGGIGFVFTEGNDLGGIDLDGCRNPETGALTKWAEAIVKAFNTYTEVSPSGTGVKMWALGAPPNISPNMIHMEGEAIKGKSPAVEAYTHSRYFAVTGQHLEGTPKEINSVPSAWLKMVKYLKDNSKPTTTPGTGTRGTVPDLTGGRNSSLTSLAGAMRKRGMDESTILIALRAENLKRFNPPLPEQELITIAKSVCRYDPSKDGFIRSTKGDVLPNHQDNVRLALAKMNLKFRYNVFADRLLMKEGDKSEDVMDDATMDRIWLELDTTFHFRPTLDFFKRFVPNECRKTPFHPVQDYLAGLKWDGTVRIDNWLSTYAQAADNEYTRAVGALVLIAAVRRVRKPGVKFDEMLILESTQGTNKSSFLGVLAKEDAWFTDDLPLTAESKEVIERTAGKWIVEAAELSGMKKSDVESLKSFLSRRVEVARLAYDRLTTERPRHFIVIGTTNAQYYLKDTTGNRRFWPVRVTSFDIDKLKEDRDQLWAEAAYRESRGDSIRLKPELYDVAGIAQEKRRVDDPWEQAIEQTIGDLNGKISTDDVWRLLDIPVNRRTQYENERVGEVMRRQGFERKKARVQGKVSWTYQRGSVEEREFNQIVLDFDAENGSSQAILKKTHSENK